MRLVKKTVNQDDTEADSVGASPFWTLANVNGRQRIDSDLPARRRADSCAVDVKNASPSAERIFGRQHAHVAGDVRVPNIPLVVGRDAVGAGVTTRQSKYFRVAIAQTTEA